MEKWGCLFDVDGVIVDSESRYTTFWNGIEELYPTGIPNYAISIKGSNLPTILHTYYDSDVVRHDIEQKLNEFETSMSYVIFQGVTDFLEELRLANVPCAIVTSSMPDKMERLFHSHPDLKHYFSGFIYGNMVTRPKPDPECYLKGAASIGIDISRCFVFEDSVNGLKAGKAANAHTIALSTTLSANRLKTLEPDMIIPSFIGFHISELITLL